MHAKVVFFARLRAFVRSTSNAGRLRLGSVSLAAFGGLFAAGLLITSVGGAAAAAPVGLGTASSFVVLAGAGVTNTGPTTLNGDIGTFPTTSISGASSLTITGTNHAGDAVSQQAKNDLVTAYNDIAGRGPTTAVPADLGGQTLAPGVYNSASSLGLTGALTLNAGGDPNAIFVFQAGSTLTTASASSVNLVNGAQACNVYWQVGSSATLGTGSSFRGTIVALTSITLTTGATVEGRVLARNGAVALDTNTITAPSCAAPVATTATTAAATTTTAATPPVVTPVKKPLATPAKKAVAKPAVKKVVAKPVARKPVARKPAVRKPVAAPPTHARPPVTHIALTG